MIHTLDPREAFLKEINAFQPLESTAASYLHELLRSREFSRGETLLPIGQVNQHLHFVHTGLVRGYHMQQNEPGIENKSTSLFASTSHFVISPPSFLKQVPSHEGFDVLEDSVVVSLAYRDIQSLYKAHASARTISQMLIERYLLFFDERVRVLKLLTGKQKYEWFLKYHPELRNRVQDNHIASYLGMTPVNLSRIRGQKA